MHRQLAAIIEGEEAALPQSQRFINQLPGSAGFLPRGGGPGCCGRRVLRDSCFGGPAAARDSRAAGRFQHPDDDFDIMFAKAVEAKSLVGGVNLPVGAHFGVAVAGGPFSHIGVKTLAVFHDGRQQEQIAALLHLRQQTAAHLVARLRLDPRLTIGAILRAEPREEQAQEVIDLRDRGHRALAAAAGIALFDADRRGNAGDEVHVRPGHLLDKLPRVSVHRIEEAALALGKNQVEGQRALARTAHAGDHHELPARNRDREVLQIVLARAVDADGIGRGVGIGVQHGFL